MKVYQWQDLSLAERASLLKRPALKDDVLLYGRVKNILKAVKEQGDGAVSAFSQEFDSVDEPRRIRDGEFRLAEETVTADEKAWIDFAIEQVSAFHKPQRPEAIQVETRPGVVCRREFRPIENVGLYVPGGTAPLVSTVMMLAVPARIAGCPRVILATPPQKGEQLVDPRILYAAQKCGVKEVYGMGGAQAVAAMGYGTQTIKKVDKIFGPGNSYVTAAKSLLALDPSGAACDMPAGPSEVLVIGDEHANPAFIAADLLSQAEHDPESQVVLVSVCREIIERTLIEVNGQLATLPRRDIARKALENSFAIYSATIDEALAISNNYAPEHLIIQATDTESLVPKIKNAGSVFLGPYSPEAAGDYASGTNHVLPTYGFAKSTSGLGVEAFLKQITFQELTYEGLSALGETVIGLSGIESLAAHGRAVKIRLQKNPEGQ
jgi:histidinol dehydrogenase